ncbi:MAG: hypothetical protein KF888_05715 [Nitrosomonas sp.]|nr:hypothetical protein [Nitrosomonas sp.]
MQALKQAIEKCVRGSRYKAKTSEKAAFIYVINEHSEPVLNTAAATQIVFQQHASAWRANELSRFVVQDLSGFIGNPGRILKETNGIVTDYGCGDLC